MHGYPITVPVVHRNTGRAIVTRLTAPLRRWMQRSDQRWCLRELDDAALKDIGISRRQAEQEADKHFWQ